MLRQSRAGLLVGAAHGERCIYATFTSLPGAQVTDLHRWWRALVKQVARRWGHMEYHAVVEAGDVSGMLHLDVLWRGPFVPQKWLAERWCGLSGGAKFVRIEAVRWGAAGRAGLTRYHAKGLAEYHSKAPVAARVWVSQGWLPAGSAGVWRELWGQFWRGQYGLRLAFGEPDGGEAMRVLWRGLRDTWDAFLQGESIEVQGMRHGWRYRLWFNRVSGSYKIEAQPLGARSGAERS